MNTTSLQFQKYKINMKFDYIQNISLTVAQKTSILNKLNYRGLQKAPVYCSMKQFADIEYSSKF